jgi:hypothetical protein
MEKIVLILDYLIFSKLMGHVLNYCTVAIWKQKNFNLVDKD